MEIKKVTIQDQEYLCDIDLNIEDWKGVLQDVNFEKYIDTLIKFHSEPNHKSTCKALGDKYNVSPQSFNGTITNFAKAVQKKLNRFEIIGTDGKPTYWIIPMQGKHVGVFFEWTLRPELVQAMEELNIKGKHLLQKIYDEAIENGHWVFFDWFVKYKEQVVKFRKQALENDWTDDLLQSLIKEVDNGISGLRQGNFNWEEYEKIKSNWSEIQPVIHNIAEKNHISKQEYQEIVNFISKQTSVNRPAGTNRIVAAFLPNVVTTAVTYGYLQNVIDNLKNRLTDYPEIHQDWLTDNFNFIEYCNSNVEFKDSWHSSVFAWYLKEYFEEERQLIQKNEASMQKYIDLLLNNKNLILTGAPGTGKTYLAKEIAKALNAETEFVQFHPSYDYTDFVEGLRPTAPDDKGNIGFGRKDGAFKEFCRKALKANTTNEVDNFDEAWDKLLVVVKDNLANSQLTKIGSWDFSLSTKDSLKYSSTNTPSEYNFTITRQNVYDAYQNKKARPSGAFQKDMEDVVQYMKENLQLKDYREGAILQEAENNIFVFIIDEINRAEISKVFGELFFSIDAGYRGEKGRVKTQYTNLQDDGDVFKEGFYIPENVYIIGTMNDIDRSVESFDFAMRRRFAWKEIKAIDRISMWDGAIDDWKDEALIRMKSLNSKIETIQGLGSAFHIGPAYFLKLKNYNGSFAQLWENHLEGVLFEYLRGFPDSVLRLNELKTAYEVIIESQGNVEND